MSKNMHIINLNDNEILRALEYRLQYDKFRRRWDSDSVSQVCAALQRPIISKCQHSAKFGNTVHVKGSIPCPATYFRFSFRYWRKYVHFSTSFKTA